MSRQQRRPSRLWLFFWGRKRRGFPGLLVGLLVAAALLGLTYALPRGASFSYAVGIAFVVAIAVLALAALAFALLASLRRRGRR